MTTKNNQKLMWRVKIKKNKERKRKKRGEKNRKIGKMKKKKRKKLIRVNKNKLHVKARRQITNINLRAHTWYV